MEDEGPGRELANDQADPLSHAHRHPPEEVNHLLSAHVGLVVAAHDPGHIAVGVVDVEDLNVVRPSWKVPLLVVGDIAAAIRYSYV